MGRKPHIPPASVAMIQKMKIIDELMPAIELVVSKQISLEDFNSEVAPLAAMRMASLILSEDEGIAFKAAQEIMNRAVGKPMERKQVLNADVKDLNQNQIDNEIRRYLEKPEEAAVVKEIIKRQPKVADLGRD